MNVDACKTQLFHASRSTGLQVDAASHYLFHCEQDRESSILFEIMLPDTELIMIILSEGNENKIRAGNR
jgi:hypothetical protein